MTSSHPAQSPAAVLDTPDRAASGPRRRRPLWGLAAVPAALLLLAGCAFTALAALQAGSGGDFGTSAHRFTTDTAALKSDEIQVGESSAHAADPDPDIGELARVRVTVRAADPDTRMFVGIGPKDEVEAYLSGGAYEEFRSADLSPFRADFRRVPGKARLADPRAQTFWVATSEGTGERTLEWNKTHGTWSVVTLRTDTGSGLDVSASIGLRFGFLLPSGIGSLAAGTALLAYGLTRRRSSGRLPSRPVTDS